MENLVPPSFPMKLAFLMSDPSYLVKIATGKIGWWASWIMGTTYFVWDEAVGLTHKYFFKALL